MMIEERINSLSPRLKRMAAMYSSSTFETAEDLYQSMMVHLLERQAKDDTFCLQTDSYILDAGRKRVCWDTLRKNKTHDKYIMGEPASSETQDEDYFDSFPASGVSPEVACENLEQAIAIAGIIRQTLSGREREVLSLVVCGARTGEIAASLQITAAAVSIYKRRIAKKVKNEVR